MDGGLDEIERVAQLVRDAASDLSDAGQTLDALLTKKVLGLVGVFDHREVKVEELVEGADGGIQSAGVTLPVVVQHADQTVADTRKCDVRVNLLEADLNMPPADAPADG